MKTLLKMVFAAATALLVTGSSLARAQEIPEGFFLPPINPTGATLEETLAALPLEKSYLPAPDSPLTGPVTGIHAWNVRKTYLDLTTR